ncbi:hypothetical protein E4U55_005997 [Claviceps digitariae]|nr:hypothetical protein E4U55_005997 [Claviceps digitariae]
MEMTDGVAVSSECGLGTEGNFWSDSKPQSAQPGRTGAVSRSETASLVPGAAGAGKSQFSLPWSRWLAVEVAKARLSGDAVLLSDGWPATISSHYYHAILGQPPGIFDSEQDLCSEVIEESVEHYGAAPLTPALKAAIE